MNHRAPATGAPLPGARHRVRHPLRRPAPRPIVAPADLAQAQVGNGAVVAHASALHPIPAAGTTELAPGAHTGFGNARLARHLAPGAPAGAASGPGAQPGGGPAPAAAAYPTAAPEHEVGEAAAAPPAPAVAAPPAAGQAAPPADAEGGSATPRTSAGEGAAAPGTPAGGAAPEAAPAAAGGAAPAADPGNALAAMAALPASGAVRGLARARARGAASFNQMHEALADNPPSIERPSGLPRRATPEQPAGAAQPAVAAAPGGHAIAAPPAAAPAPAPVESAAPPAPLPAAAVDPNLLDQVPEEDPAQMHAFAAQLLGRVPAADESVDTSAGERPTVRLTQDADPAQMAHGEEVHRDAADAAWIGARAEMTVDEGEHNIFPTVPQETLTGHAGTTRPAPAPRPLRGPVLAQPGVASAVDAAAGPDWTRRTAQAQQENAAAMEQRQAGERAERARTDAHIAQAEQDAADAQSGHQAQAQQEVAAARTAWSGELGAADRTYTSTVTTLRADHQSQIDRHQQDANSQARVALERGEAEAAAERAASVAQAEARKREARRESGGFVGWLKSRAKSLINAVRNAVNAIFNALRRAVRFIIDRAKRLAVRLIEMARSAIVGLIRRFGALLERAADVFLGLFPGARDRAKAWIRRAVRGAEDAVNAAANALSRRVCQLLDALGAAIDFIIDVYQRAYNAILDVVEFFVVGLLEIIEGIGRLGESASMVGDHFMGQVQEEGIGVDLTQPLAIERPEREPDAATAAQGAVATGSIAPSDAALLSRSSLDNSDVTVEPVAQLHLEPELLDAVVPRAAEGDYHFGQNEAPENQRDAILAGALGAQTGAAPQEAEGTEAAQQPAGPAPAGPAPAGPDPASMTPEEQLEHLEAQEVPHTCAAQKTEEPAGPAALPAHMRIYGPFTSGQRFRYMWGQIRTGISQWWSCNWGTVVAVFAIGALIALLLGILTGGAIFAAIPPLLEIIGTILIGVALARATIYIRDYIAQAWRGNLAAGARALARGFAILIIELIFALLFNLPAVIRAARSGIRGAVSAAGRAVKSTVRSTIAAGRRLRRIGAVAFTRGVRNSRLIISGFRQGFGQGIRTIGDLTSQMLRKMRFRGFFFRLRGLWLELWGRFNPTVPLGRFRLTLAQAERYFRRIAAAGRSLSPAARAEGMAIVRAVAAVAESGGALDAVLRRRIQRFFLRFRSQHVLHNPVLAEVWTRALGALQKIPRYKVYFRNGQLVKNVPAHRMLEMYGLARGNMGEALSQVLAQLERDFGRQLAHRLTELPAHLQVHHLLYKAIHPELALAHGNLILALRRTAGGADELHDLLHLLSAAGQGNRWRTLNQEIADIIRDLYGI